MLTIYSKWNEYSRMTFHHSVTVNNTWCACASVHSWCACACAPVHSWWVCVCAHVHSCLPIWAYVEVSVSDVSVSSLPYFGDSVVHWTWNMLILQDWLASELQISTICFTRCQGYICYDPEFQILCGYFILCHKYFACWDASQAPLILFLKHFISVCMSCVYVGTRGQLLRLILFPQCHPGERIHQMLVASAILLAQLNCFLKMFSCIFVR